MDGHKDGQPVGQMDTQVDERLDVQVDVYQDGQQIWQTVVTHRGQKFSLIHPNFSGIEQQHPAITAIFQLLFDTGPIPVRQDLPTHWTYFLFSPQRMTIFGNPIQFRLLNSNILL
ncbi:MAG: hypothetical protein HQK60_05165 [Deltaproteobacteria bacterium]|nr:hypothetical protein [Deltaproteobacteria bacterium]